MQPSLPSNTRTFSSPHIHQQTLPFFPSHLGPRQPLIYLLSLNSLLICRLLLFPSYAIYLLRKLGHSTSEFAQVGFPRLPPWGVVYRVPLFCISCKWIVRSGVLIRFKLDWGGIPGVVNVCKEAHDVGFSLFEALTAVGNCCPDPLIHPRSHNGAVLTQSSLLICELA